MEDKYGNEEFDYPDDLHVEHLKQLLGLQSQILRDIQSLLKERLAYCDKVLDRQMEEVERLAK